MRDYERVTKEEAEALVDRRHPDDSMAIRLLLEIRDQMQAPAEESNEPAPAATETRVPQPQRCSLVVRASGAKMEPLTHGVWMRVASVELYVQARIKEAFVIHKDAPVHSRRRLEDEIAGLDQQIRALAEGLGCAFRGGTTADIIGGIEQARDQWGWNNEAEIAVKHHEPLDIARMDQIEAMAKRGTFLGHRGAGLQGSFVELRRGGILHSYDTVREATDAEMEENPT